MAHCRDLYRQLRESFAIRHILGSMLGQQKVSLVSDFIFSSPRRPECKSFEKVLQLVGSTTMRSSRAYIPYGINECLLVRLKKSKNLRFTYEAQPRLGTENRWTLVTNVAFNVPAVDRKGWTIHGIGLVLGNGESTIKSQHGKCVHSLIFVCTNSNAPSLNQWGKSARQRLCWIEYKIQSFIIRNNLELFTKPILL